MDLPDYSQDGSQGRLIKTSYNKRMSRKSSRGSRGSRGSRSSGSSNGSMMGYFRKGTKRRMNKTTYSSDSSMSNCSRHNQSMRRKYKTSRKKLKSGAGVRIRTSKKGKVFSINFCLGRRPTHTKSMKESSLSSVNSSIHTPGGVINEISDSESEDFEARLRKKRVKTEEKKTRKHNKDSKSSHLYTITNNTNIIYNSAFPDLKTEKVANRLMKRKTKNSSEIGYLNFPVRSTQKIQQIKNETMMNKNISKLKQEMLKKSAAIGGALTQFKKRKQRRMIKQMLNEENSSYGVR